MNTAMIPLKFLRKPQLLALYFVLLIPFTAQSQNYYMAEGQSDLHAGAEIAYNSFENFYAIFPGYTFNGRLTFGLGIGKNKDLVNKLNSTFFRPYASYLLLKQSEEGLPVSVDVNVGYQFNYVQQVIFNTKSILFGGGIYHELAPLGNVKLIPAFLVSGTKATSGPNIQFQEEVVFAYGGQVSLVWNNYYLTPKISIYDGITTISATLGILFSS